MSMVHWYEGWEVMASGEIIRLDIWDSDDVFKSNAEAIAFVQQRAAEGSEMHAQALARHVAARMTRGQEATFFVPVIKMNMS